VGHHLPALAAEVRALRDGAELPEDDPTTVSADAGYVSGEHAAHDGDGLDLLIAAGRDDPATAASRSGSWSADCFGYDPARDVWICPADKLLVRQVTLPGATGRPSKHRYLAGLDDCAACPLRACCLKPGEERRLLVSQRSRPTGAMRFKLRQPDARRRYARRKAIVEPVFGQLNEARGFTTISLRGLTRAAGEYLLACLAHNFAKLLRVCPIPSTMPAPAGVLFAPLAPPPHSRSRQPPPRVEATLDSCYLTTPTPTTMLARRPSSSPLLADP
jgi:Transposase DDE domain